MPDTFDFRLGLTDKSGSATEAGQRTREISRYLPEKFFPGAASLKAARALAEAERRSCAWEVAAVLACVAVDSIRTEADQPSLLDELRFFRRTRQGRTEGLSYRNYARAEGLLRKICSILGIAPETPAALASSKAILTSLAAGFVDDTYAVEYDHGKPPARVLSNAYGSLQYLEVARKHCDAEAVLAIRLRDGNDRTFVTPIKPGYAILAAPHLSEVTELAFRMIHYPDHTRRLRYVKKVRFNGVPHWLTLHRRSWSSPAVTHILAAELARGYLAYDRTQQLHNHRLLQQLDAAKVVFGEVIQKEGMKASDLFLAKLGDIRSVDELTQRDLRLWPDELVAPEFRKVFHLLDPKPVRLGDGHAHIVHDQHDHKPKGVLCRSLEIPAELLTDSRQPWNLLRLRAHRFCSVRVLDRYGHFCDYSEPRSLCRTLFWKARHFSYATSAL